MPVDVLTFSSPQEALQRLSGDPSAHIHGGGTSLMRLVHEGHQTIRTLIRLSDPTMATITRTGRGLRIGAQVTMARILAAPEAEILHVAARSVGAPALRNMGTVAGNLFAPAPYGDLAAALLALNAEVELASRTGQAETRTLERFFADRHSAGTRPVVMAVHVPLVSGVTLAFHKMQRSHPRGASIVTTALAARISAGRLSDVRLAFGGISGAPVLAKAAGRVLTQGALSPATIEAAKARATDGLQLRDDALASAWYRGEMASLQLGRLLEALR